MAQASLDEYLETEEEENEGVEVREEEHVEGVDVVEEEEEIGEDVSASIRDPEHKSRCRYCNEWVGRLHGGSIDLYVKNGRLTALADMDHVYQDCKHGLVENLKFLHKLMAYLRARGYKVFAVGKAYDDLYAWAYGKKIKDIRI